MGALRAGLSFEFLPAEGRRGGSRVNSYAGDRLTLAGGELIITITTQRACCDCQACPHHSQQSARDTVRKESHFQMLGQIALVLFLEKNIK